MLTRSNKIMNGTVDRILLDSVQLGGGVILTPKNLLLSGTAWEGRKIYWGVQPPTPGNSNPVGGLNATF